MSYLLYVKNAAQLVCVSNDLSLFKTKEAMNDVCMIENGSMIIDFDGVIHDIGPSNLISEKYKDAKFIQDINCEGKSIIPGFVDPHTHSIFSGDRLNEFIMNIEGKSYAEILQTGGGIHYTVSHVRISSESELLSLLLLRLPQLLRQGTTTVEIKSGYGLDLENEIKMLKVAHKAKKIGLMGIVSTYAGGNAVQKGMKEEEAVKEIVEVHLEKIKELKEKGEISPEFIDVFCEKGVFGRESAKRILEAGIKLGLKGHFHGDMMNFMDSATLSSELSDISAITHLEYIDEKGSEAMAKSGSVAIMAPTIQYALKLKVPPVRDMVEKGVIVALGSDFSPSVHCYSMPTIMNMACINYKFKTNEALVAATLNSASALKKSNEIGSLEKGKKADFLIIKAKRWENIIYQLGENLVESVFWRGKKVV